LVSVVNVCVSTWAVSMRSPQEHVQNMAIIIHS
jgi:hypothetical protein